jgi:hypothetical protein
MASLCTIIGSNWNRRLGVLGTVVSNYLRVGPYRAALSITDEALNNILILGAILLCCELG